MLRYMKTMSWRRMNPMELEIYKRYGKKLGKQMGVIAAVWALLYFPSQMLNEGVPALFAPMVGGVVGLWAGWWVAEDAAEEAGFSGLTLWVILVGACVAAIWGTEKVLGWVVPCVGSWFGHGGEWPIGFGRWMMLTGATLLAMAAAVWRASADD